MSNELYDQEAEKVVIGTLLQENSIYYDICNFLKPEHFYFRPNQIIYQAILDEMESQNQVDLLLLIAHLKNKNMLEQAGEHVYIASLIEASSSLGAVDFAKRVKDFFLRRTFQQELTKLGKDISNLQIGFQDTIFQMEKSIQSVMNEFSFSGIVHVQALTEEIINYVKRLQESKDSIVGIPSKFENLDKITSGFKSGQLIILAARPGMGKTTFALNIAQNIALTKSHSVLFYSLEMTRLELLIRMLCSYAMLNAIELQRGNIKENDISKIVETMQELSTTEMYIDDTANMSTSELKFKTRQLANKLTRENKKLDFVVVDYLQLMKDPIGFKEGRQREIANISREMKLLSKELNISILAVSQMNRSIEQRGKDTKPQLSDLRESGAIEQDADIVMFIHRESNNSEDSGIETQSMSEITIAKNRVGPSGSFQLCFKKEKNLFLDVVKVPE